VFCVQTSDVVLLLMLQIMKSDVWCTLNEYALPRFEPVQNNRQNCSFVYVNNCIFK